MKPKFTLLIFFAFFSPFLFSQNIGVGTSTPGGKLHIKGSADIPQLVIDANTTQSNQRPLLKFRDNTGSDLLWLHSDHVSNVFIGRNVGEVNIATSTGDLGKYNTLIGTLAGHTNSTGWFNTATGYEALRENTTGYRNASYGYRSLLSNTSGENNCAFGATTLAANTTGGTNTAIGSHAMAENVDGGVNTAVGANAMTNLLTGAANTSIGAYSMFAATSGNGNVAVGYSAMNSNRTGNFNIAIGNLSLSMTTASEYNTAIGHQAGTNRNFGFNNTFIGALSGASEDDMFNCIAIGKDALCTASSQARIGNTFTNSIGGYANWTNFSDGRYKKNLKEDVKGLDFIMKLRPVTYQLNISGVEQRMKHTNTGENLKAIAEKEKEIISGFVAQEVEQAAQQTGYEFSGVDKPKNANDFYGLRYAEFVVPLVKAMQEQQQMINDMRKEITLLKKLLDSKK